MNNNRMNWAKSEKKVEKEKTAATKIKNKKQKVAVSFKQTTTSIYETNNNKYL